MTESNSTYIVDKFITVKPGEPFRLFKFGKIVKNGKIRELTRELAGKFKLPHYRPAVKLGSHDDVTPAGGHITGLEVRDDGLWANVEWNEKGLEAVSTGAYRYHSPEVIWEGGFESPDGGMIEAPLIVGTALLHDPHLGEQTAFYQAETKSLTEDNIMANEENMIPVPASLWEQMTAIFKRDEPEPEPAEQPEPEISKEEFEAKVTEAENYKAELDALKAEGAKKARVESFANDFAEVEAFGEDAELFEWLAGLSEEDAKFIVQRLKAVGAQVEESELTKEHGEDGLSADDNPAIAYHAEIARVQKEKGVTYGEAMTIVNDTNPALFEAYQNG